MTREDVIVAGHCVICFYDGPLIRGDDGSPICEDVTGCIERIATRIGSGPVAPPVVERLFECPGCKRRSRSTDLRPGHWCPDMGDAYMAWEVVRV